MQEEVKVTNEDKDLILMFGAVFDDQMMKKEYHD